MDNELVLRRMEEYGLWTAPGQMFVVERFIFVMHNGQLCDLFLSIYVFRIQIGLAFSFLSRGSSVEYDTKFLLVTDN